MNFIEEYYDNINIYFSLIIYDDEPPHHLISNLKARDYPIILLNDFTDLDFTEMHHRMFVVHIDQFQELLFVKQNDIHQYSVIFCLGDTMKHIECILLNEKPKCVENILITKI